LGELKRTLSVPVVGYHRRGMYCVLRALETSGGFKPHSQYGVCNLHWTEWRRAYTANAP